MSRQPFNRYGKRITNACHRTASLVVNFAWHFPGIPGDAQSSPCVLTKKRGRLQIEPWERISRQPSHSWHRSRTKLFAVDRSLMRFIRESVG